VFTLPLETPLEAVSYALIAAMGAYLLWTGTKPMLTVIRPIAFATVPDQKSMARHSNPDHNFKIVMPHAHDDGADCDCGHAHVPAARDTRWLAWMTTGLRLTAGAGILIFGIILALGSLSQSGSA
jgi:ABC-type nickel/cobalt efflux system permease component RcnA